MRHFHSLRTAPALAGCATALVLAALLAWLALPPRTAPAPDGAPASGFSGARALAHVTALAQAPRPVGSAANAAARAYLVAQIRALGLAPEIQTETVQASSVNMMAHVSITLAEVHNVLVRKPGVLRRHGAAGAGQGQGQSERDAILVAARYDSGKDSVGAADGALSAAAMLEALRVLQAGPPLDNDLLFVFTDADGAQALGSRGLVQSHPWARRARVALRFDNPGNRGPLRLIDASHADGFTVDAWARLPSGAASGDAFMAALYQALPQRAAGDALAASGASVLQFATTGGPLGDAYGNVFGGPGHDIPQRLSRASLQQEGDAMLALLRHFGNAVLPSSSTGAPRGRVFFTVPLLGAVHYVLALAWPLALLATLLTALACRRAVRRQGIAGADIVHGAFGFLFMAALAVFLTFLCRDAMAGLRARYDVGMLVADDSVRWQLLAFLSLALALFLPLQRRLQARLGAAVAALGAIVVANVFLLLCCRFAPGASYVLAWPLLAAQAAWLVLASPRARAWPPHLARRVRLALPAAAALPALALILPAAYDGMAYLSPQWLVLPCVLLCFAPALCGQLLAELDARLRAGTPLLAGPLLAGALLLGGAGCIGMAYAASPAWPALPAPNRLVYLKDALTWRAFWLHPPQPLDAWTRQVFPTSRTPLPMPYTFAGGSPLWQAAAPRIDAISYPYLIIEKDQRPGMRRHVEFLLRSKNGAPELTLTLIGADTLRSSVNGRLLTERRHRGWKMTLHGMGDRELRFAFDLLGDPAFTVYIQEHIPGLPMRYLPARAATMPALLPQTGTTVAADILVFRGQ